MRLRMILGVFISAFTAQLSQLGVPAAELSEIPAVEKN